MCQIKTDTFIVLLSASSLITIVKGNSVFQLQTPSIKISSPNKSVLQRDHVDQLQQIIDYVLASKQDRDYLLSF
jgi:hypothetical protein